MTRVISFRQLMSQLIGDPQESQRVLSGEARKMLRELSTLVSSINLTIRRLSLETYDKDLLLDTVAISVEEINNHDPHQVGQLIALLSGVYKKLLNFTERKNYEIEEVDEVFDTDAAI